MSDDNNKSLLPINATNLMKDLESVTINVTNLETINRFVNNPDKALENILPWLAWTVSVDNWSDNWPAETRRNIIKSSIEIHRHKGTIGALKKALKTFNYNNIKIQEWFEYRGNPYFFRVFIEITTPGFDVNKLGEILKVIENIKNTRSHLEYLRGHLITKSSPTIGIFTISKEITIIYPKQT